jgi:hypothetical protein
MRDFDDLLDGVLAEYSQAEPPLGLEARVLRGMEKPRRDVRWWWGLVPAGGVAAVAVVLLQPAPVLDVPVLWDRGSDPIPAVAFQLTAHEPQAAQTVKRWPTVEAEQRAFIEFARAHPEEAARTLQFADEVMIEPLTIEPLTIAGLDDKGDL